MGRDFKAMRKRLAQAEIRMQELDLEVRDLHEICAAKGVNSHELLAARKHRRMFAEACTEHALGKPAGASDALIKMRISPPLLRATVFKCDRRQIEIQ